MQFLQSIFSSLENMKGIVVKMKLEAGYDEFKRKFGDPLKEHTLIIRDDDYMFLVFEHDERRCVKDVCKDVVVVDKIKYNKNSYVYKKITPAQVPIQLVKYIFVSEKLVCSIDEDSLDNFLEKYCVRTGFARLVEIKALPGWRNEWREQLDMCLLLFIQNFVWYSSSWYLFHGLRVAFGVWSTAKKYIPPYQKTISSGRFRLP